MAVLEGLVLSVKGHHFREGFEQIEEKTSGPALLPLSHDQTSPTGHSGLEVVIESYILCLRIIPLLLLTDCTAIYNCVYLCKLRNYVCTSRKQLSNVRTMHLSAFTIVSDDSISSFL